MFYKDWKWTRYFTCSVISIIFISIITFIKMLNCYMLISVAVEIHGTIHIIEKFESNQELFKRKIMEDNQFSDF